MKEDHNQKGCRNGGDKYRKCGQGVPQIIKNHEQIDAKVFEDVGTLWVRSGGVHIGAYSDTWEPLGRFWVQV
jgi:hypothetical protein